MKRIVSNTFIILISTTALLVVSFLGTGYLLAPNYLMLPHSIPAAVNLDILILCVLPCILFSTLYFFLFVLYKDNIDSAVLSFLNKVPLVMLVTVILAIDNTFSHSTRDFGNSEFIGYYTPEGTVFVFPNTTRIILVVLLITVALVYAQKIFSYSTAYLRSTYTRIAGKKSTPDSSIEKTQEANKRVEKKLTLVPYMVASLVMPSNMLFLLYNNNRAVNSLVFTHILILAGLFGVIGFLVYLAFRRSTGSSEGALLLSIIFWLFFWLFEAGYSIVSRIIENTLTPIGFMVVLALVLLCISKVIRRYKAKLAKLSIVFVVLALYLPAMFIFNFLPGVIHEIELSRARAVIISEENQPSYFKSDFILDETLPAPDIYWVLMDGMMSLETYEYFFEISQDRFREEFASRGLLIYPDARLIAGNTRAATAALFSPHFYDVFLGELYAQVEEEMIPYRNEYQASGWNQLGFTYMSDIAPNLELLIALINRGYEIEYIRYCNEHFLPLSLKALSRNDYVNNENWITVILSKSGDLPELLNRTTPLRITLLRERTARMSAGAEQRRDSSRPRFVVDVHDLKLGDMSKEAMQQLRMARFALDFIDGVLADNPDAVIVIQSDHGPAHSNENQERMLAQGYSAEQVLKQLFSVFSAVRIPEKYGGLDEPIAPLNISRELVNRFVGQNYELVP